MKRLQSTTVPQTDIFAPSPSTEESVTAFIERTLMSLDQAGEDLDVPLLAPQASCTNDGPYNCDIVKVSDSNAIQKVLNTQPQEIQELSKAVDQTEVT